MSFSASATLKTNESAQGKTIKKLSLRPFMGASIEKNEIFVLGISVNMKWNLGELWTIFISVESVVVVKGNKAKLQLLWE